MTAYTADRIVRRAIEIGRARKLARRARETMVYSCLLYTSDAADERSSVDLGGRRILKKKTSAELNRRQPRDRHSHNTSQLA